MQDKYKGVLLDLDQTLANTEDYTFVLDNTKALNYKIYAEYRVYIFLRPFLKIVSWEVFIEAFEAARTEIKKQLKGTAASHNRYLYIQRTLELLHLRFRPKLIYDATQVYWDFILKKSKLFPHVKETLKVIKQNHLKTAIITDLTADIQIKKLNQYKIESYIDYLVTSEEANADKPSPAQIKLALDKMKLNSKEVILVGNNPATDIQAAQSLQIPAILFDYHNSYRNYKPKANYHITKFNELLGILKISDTTYSEKRLIAIDLNGTLTTESHIVAKLLRAVVPKNYKLLKTQYEDYKVSRISNRTFWRNLGVDDPRKTEQRFFKQFTLRNDVIKLLTDLKKHYSLAILSNMPSKWGWTLVEKFDLQKYFDTIIFSGDYKSKKPDPDLYKVLIHKHPDINPENIYFVDDELSDLAGGKDFLMKTVWLKNKGQKITFIPDEVVGGVNDLRKLFLV